MSAGTPSLCIVAGSHQEAHLEAQRRGLKLTEWWYPRNPTMMRGLKGGYRHIRVGNWHKRADAKEIDHELQLAGAVGE